MKQEYDPNELGELLPVYYEFLFPANKFYNWLLYQPKTSGEGKYQRTMIPINFDDSLGLIDS